MEVPGESEPRWRVEHITLNEASEILPYINAQLVSPGIKIVIPEKKGQHMPLDGLEPKNSEVLIELHAKDGPSITNFRNKLDKIMEQNE